MANGKGKFWHSDGDYYEGIWLDDKAHGQGLYTSANGSSYIGQWENDMQHGYGRETWTDKSSYEGQYNQGRSKAKDSISMPMDQFMTVSGEIIRLTAQGRTPGKMANNTRVNGRLEI